MVDVGYFRRLFTHLVLFLPFSCRIADLGRTVDTERHRTFRSLDNPVTSHTVERTLSISEPIPKARRPKILPLIYGVLYMGLLGRALYRAEINQQTLRL